MLPETARKRRERCRIHEDRGVHLDQSATLLIGRPVRRAIDFRAKYASGRALGPKHLESPDLRLETALARDGNNLHV